MIATAVQTLSLDAASQADITRSSIAKAIAALAKEGGRMNQVAISLGFGAAAWARILAVAERRVVAGLLGLMALVVPEWVSKGVAEAIN
jgi:hypothetical protein